MANTGKVLLITVTWILVAVVISIYDHLVLSADFSAGTGNSYSFLTMLALNICVGGAAALTGGSFIVFYVNEKYRSHSYWKSIALVAFSFAIVSTSLVVIVSYIQSVVPDERSNDSSFEYFLFDFMHLKNILVWSIVVAFTQFIIQIDNKFGHGVLLNLITGHYQRPHEETRIFMMLDLVSSTQLAEQMERDRYHLFLRDFFADITKPILSNKGEIYQYVGDEVVVSWCIGNDVFDSRCLKCFFDINEAILQVRDKYITKYGVVPEFKAGFHGGKVIAGEIGIVKKDITYSGDVLNTASRIRSKCTEYQVKILASDELLLNLDYDADFSRIPVGEIELKGKHNKMCLSTLRLRAK